MKSIPTAVYIPNPKAKRYKAIDAVLFVLFLLSMGLVIWGIDIYRHTIIEAKFLFVAVSLGTISTAVILLFITRGFLNAFWTFVIALGIGGGMAYFLTLYVNWELAEGEEVVTESFHITDTGTLAKGTRGGCGSPFALVDFYGYEKEFIFPCEFERNIQNYKRVQLDYYKGYFGFMVVKKKVLIP